jgi:predicted RNA-binding Zn ribbon-like protein
MYCPSDFAPPSDLPAAIQVNRALDFLNGQIGEEGSVLRHASEQARASPPAARLLATEAQHLRVAIARLVDAHARGAPLPEPALFVLNRVLRAGPRTTRVVAGPASFTVEECLAADGPNPADLAPTAALAALGPIAVATARLLATADPHRLRTCAASDCAAWFLDTSKSGRRRWCSMERCGNRAKAARHRRRRAAAS